MSDKTAAAFQKVRGGKLSFKGGEGPERIIKKGKKKRKQKPVDVEDANGEPAPAEKEEGKAAEDGPDTGIGFAPDGRKKTAKYEEMFPVETRRFGYVAPKDVKTREDALDVREKKKADRYCK